MPGDSDDDKLPQDGFIVPFPETSSRDYLVKDGKGPNTVQEIIDPIDIEIENIERDEFITNDPLVKSIDDRLGTSDVINTLLKEVAEEIANLKFERRVANRQGQKTLGIIANRINGLRQFAEILIKRHESSRADRIDLSSPRFKRVLELWLEFLHESMTKAGIHRNDIDIVFRQMEADMADWEKKIIDIG